jgi:hypothetical protein
MARSWKRRVVDGLDDDVMKSSGGLSCLCESDRESLKETREGRKERRKELQGKEKASAQLSVDEVRGTTADENEV